jgi:hypothetical protein
MSHYVLTEKMSKILKARGIILICKICGCPILVGDEVESKQQRRGKTKLYHLKCYEDSHIDSSIPNEEIEKDLKELNIENEKNNEDDNL